MFNLELLGMSFGVLVLFISLVGLDWWFGDLNPLGSPALGLVPSFIKVSS